MLRKLFVYPGALWVPRTLVCMVLTVLSVLVWSPVCLVIILTRPTAALTRAGAGWLDFLCALYSIRVEVDHGGLPYDPAQPALIVSNHQSLWDIPAAVKAFRGANIRFVAKKELFQIPLFGTVMRYGDFIPVDRGNQTSSKAATVAIADRFRRGIHVWVAPEGTRSVGSALGIFKKGAFAVAIEAQIPVQPIVVLDSYRAQPKKSLLPRPGTVIHVKVLPAVPTTGLKSSDRTELSAKVHAAMKQCLVDFENAEKSGRA